MIKKICIASFFFIFAAFSILVMRGRLHYLDAVNVGGEALMEAKVFHTLYVLLLVIYAFFTYIFFKADPEGDNYRKIIMGMAMPLYVLGVMGIVAGIGCVTLGCTYGAEYHSQLGALLHLNFLDGFLGNAGETLYSFTVKLPI